MLTVNESIYNYIDIQHQLYNKTIQTNDIPTTKNNLRKLKCHISNNLKRHRLEIIRSNRKLCFYSIFKTDVSKSHYLEQVRNLKHGRAVAKLRSGNHSLRIESGRHCVPKLPEYLRICQHCRSNQIENENHFLFHCDRYLQVNALSERIIRIYLHEFTNNERENSIPHEAAECGIENFEFIVSERVQVNPDNSRAMSALTFLLFKLNTLQTKIVKL